MEKIPKLLYVDRLRTIYEITAKTNHFNMLTYLFVTKVDKEIGSLWTHYNKGTLSLGLSAFIVLIINDFIL